jgi:FMN phosphatase YigB (HAD superfamily)
MKNLALDIGNVLTFVDFKPIQTSLQLSINASDEEIDLFLRKSQHLFDLGILSFRDAVQDFFKIKSSYVLDTLELSWNKVIYPHEPTIKFMSDLQNKGVKIALVSNMGKDHMSLIENLLSPYNFYSRCVKHISCEVGAIKPSKLYFSSFIDFNPRFYKCVYIDDREENLKTGKLAGLTPYQFDLTKIFPVVVNQGVISNNEQEKIYQDHLQNIQKLLEL